MRSNFFKLLFLILAIGIIIFQARLIYSQDVDFSYDENLRKANEFYLAGRRYIQVGNFKAANDAFKKSQKYLEEKASLSARFEDFQMSLDDFPLDSQQSLSKTESGESGSKTAKSNIKKANLTYNQAVEFIKKGAYLPAEQALKEVIRLNPKDTDAYYNLGVLYENHLLDKKKALVYYKKYVQLAPLAENAKEVNRWIEEIYASSQAQ
jgi:tetratricopeptide (TPR) repeat protein